MKQRANNSNVLVLADRPRDWTQQELSEFYRVENALVQSGLSVSSDRGLSDEGDPWFVFLRANDHEPLVHFARVDGYYIIASSAYDGVSRGKNFKEMILNLLSRHRLNTEKISKNSNIFYHPAALLITLVGVAFFKSTYISKAGEKNSSESTSHLNNSLILSKDINPSSTSGQINATPRIAPYEVSGGFEEIAGLLLPLVAELAPNQPKSSAAEATETELNSNIDFVERELHTSKLTLNHFDNFQHDPLSSNAENGIALYSETELISQRNKTDLTAALSDAKYLLSLLNDVPISLEPVDIASFQSKLKFQTNFPVGKPETPIITHADNASKFFDLNLTHIASKNTHITLDTSEKVHNSIINDSTSPRSDESHSLTIHTITLATAGASTQTQIPFVDYKVAITTVASSALAAISNLSSSFNYLSSELSISLNLAEAINLNTQTKSPKIEVLGNKTAISDTIFDYNIYVTNNHSQNLSTSTNIGNTSINFGENEINNLLTKFLKTFSRTSFEIKSNDEFVFMTEASKLKTTSLEQITIHFQDGSNIDIIGQKSEIDGFITTL